MGISHYTMLHNYGKRKGYFVGQFYCYLSLVFYILGAFNKTVIPLALDGYEMIGYLPIQSNLVE